MPLKSLYLYEWKGSDLEPLRGLPLQRLALGSNAGLKDLGPLRGMNLDYLMVRGTGVTDLAPLKEMEVRSLECDNTCLTVENSAVLQAVKSLESFYCLVCSSEEHLAAASSTEASADDQRPPGRAILEGDRRDPRPALASSRPVFTWCHPAVRRAHRRRAASGGIRSEVPRQRRETSRLAMASPTIWAVSS